MKYNNTIILGALAILAIGMNGCSSEPQRLEGAIKARYEACIASINRYQNDGVEGGFEFETEQCRCGTKLCDYDQECNIKGVCIDSIHICNEGENKCELNDNQISTLFECINNRWKVIDQCESTCDTSTSCKSRQCEEARHYCYENIEYVCAVDRMRFVKECGKLGCKDDHCQEECQGNEIRCNNGNVEKCTNGIFQVTEPCENGCEDGKCIKSEKPDTCQMEEKERCVDGTLKQCVDMQWIPKGQCDCISEEQRCNDEKTGIESCDNYQWKLNKMCKSDEQCENMNDKYQCKKQGDSGCTNDEKKCIDDKTPAVCNGGQWVTEKPCKNGCNLATGECIQNGIVDNKCIENTYRCNGKEIQECKQKWRTIRICTDQCIENENPYQEPNCKCTTGLGLPGLHSKDCTDPSVCDTDNNELFLKDCISNLDSKFSFCPEQGSSIQVPTDKSCAGKIKERNKGKCFTISTDVNEYYWCLDNDSDEVFLEYCPNGYEHDQCKTVLPPVQKCTNTPECIGSASDGKCPNQYSCKSETECGDCQNGTYSVSLLKISICVEGKQFECEWNNDVVVNDYKYICNDTKLKDILNAKSMSNRYVNKSFVSSFKSIPMYFTTNENGEYILKDTDFAEISTVSCN